MKVVLADDHSIVRDSLRQYVERLDERAEIVEASELGDVLALAGTAPPPDLILLDLQMPGMSGAKSVADVRRAFPDTAIVMISATADNETITTAIRSGANGYIPKTMTGRSLVTALRLVLEGETYVPASVLSQPLPAVAPVLPGSQPAGGLPGVLSKLSAREADVLKLLISGKSNKEIARQLDLQEVTVKVHLRNVYRKINATNRTDAVRIVLSQGGLEHWTGGTEQT